MPLASCMGASAVYLLCAYLDPLGMARWHASWTFQEITEVVQDGFLMQVVSGLCWQLC